MSTVTSSISVLRPPIPRHVEAAGPDINPTRSGSSLVGCVIQRISSVGDGPAVCDHPAVQVFVSFEADGYDATVTIEIAWVAAHRDSIGQRKARLLSTTPSFARRSHAELAAFGGVDSEQANRLAVNFNGVAVDDGSDAEMRSSAAVGPMAENINSKAKAKALIAGSLSARRLPRLRRFPYAPPRG